MIGAYKLLKLFIVKNSKTFYRYRAFSSNTLDEVCTDRIYFANPGSFNDPLDCNPTLECDSSIPDLNKLLIYLIKKRVKNEICSGLKRAGLYKEIAMDYIEQQAIKEVLHEIIKIEYNATDPGYQLDIDKAKSLLLVQKIEDELHRYSEKGVCCFSSTYLSPLLWSHYADQHKGLCIGYGVDREQAQKLEKVIYGKNRSIKTSTLIGAFVLKNVPAQTDLSCSMFLHKANGWKYECEWRLIGKQGIQLSPLLLKEVTFGLRCENSIKYSVIKALEGTKKNIKYFEMRENKKNFTLKRYLVNNDEMNDYYPNTAESNALIIYPFSSNRSPKKDI